MAYFVRKTAPGTDTGNDWYNAFTSWSSLSSVILSGSDDIYIYSDDDIYTGDFVSYTGYIEYVGGFVVPDNVASGNTDVTLPRFKTILYPNGPLTVQGIHTINGFYVDYSGSIVNVPSGTTLLLDTVELKCIDGIVASGAISLTDVSAVGYGAGTFATINYPVGQDRLIGLKLANFDIGIDASQQVYGVNATTIHDCGTGIYLRYDSGSFTIDSSLLYNNEKSLEVTQSGNTINIIRSTITGETAIDLGNSSATLEYSIISGSINGVSNFLTGTVTNCDILPANSTITSIATDSFSSDPLFSNPLIGDFRLKVGADVFQSSPCFNAGFDTTPDSFNIISDINGFRLLTNNNVVNHEDIDLTPFLFNTKDTFIFSDEDREILLANMVTYYSDLKYSFNYRKQLIFNDIKLTPSFDLLISGVDQWPWEWDWKEIKTPEITQDNKYLVPRSILDIGTLIKQNTSYGVDALSNAVLNKAKVWDKIEYAGVSFDPLNSYLGSTIVWVLDSNNQTLIRRDLYVGEVTDTYPLLCPNVTNNEYKAFVIPSGIIPVGAQTSGKYRFIRESEPSQYIDADNEMGNIIWLPTDIDPQWDIRGMLSHKDHLFLTSVYGTTLSGVPYMLRYPNRGYYKNYITSDPTKYAMHLNNSNPQDLTVYEDGSIMVVDGTNSNSENTIYKYKLRYDYALAGDSYQQKTRYLLRENYEDVSTSKHT